MANDLSVLQPKILASALIYLRRFIVMPRLVNSDFSRETAQKGASINIPVPSSIGVEDVTPSNVPPVGQDRTPKSVNIPLDRWRQNVPFHLTDKELGEINAGPTTSR